MFGNISNFDTDFVLKFRCKHKKNVHSCTKTSSQTTVIFFPKGVLQVKVTYIISNACIELIKTCIANVALVYL